MITITPQYFTLFCIDGIVEDYPFGYTTDNLTVAKATEIRDFAKNQTTDSGWRGEIQTIGIAHLIEQLFPNYYTDYGSVSDEEEFNAIQTWTIENDAYVYSRCREDFFEWEALELAAKYGKRWVIMEDLS
jgi:hypothetical protein